MEKLLIPSFRMGLPVCTGSPDSTQSTSVEPTQTEASQSASGDRMALADKAKRERDRALFNMSSTSSSAQSKCANIDDPQWDVISPSLRKYVQARMQKALAQKNHFGEDHLAKQKGICRGMSSVWLRLHQAKPDAAASNRMDLLMSESGTAHATVAHRLYKEENGYRHTGKAPSLQALLDLGNEAQFDSEVANISNMYATQTTCVHEEFLSGKKGYIQLCKLLNKSPGYYNMGIALKNKNGEVAAHDFSVSSKGSPHPLTIYDSNLGECSVPEKDLPRFMEEMSHFYEATSGYAIMGIRSVLQMKFTDDISNTPLAQLAAELD